MKTARVLVVDDEPDLCHLIKRYLERIGHQVETALSGEEAWAAICRPTALFDVYLIDMTLPGIQGDELAERILSGQPGARIILSSGYAAERVDLQFTRPGIRFLNKPYLPKELAELIEALALESPREVPR